MRFLNVGLVSFDISSHIQSGIGGHLFASEGRMIYESSEIQAPSFSEKGEARWTPSCQY